MARDIQVLNSFSLIGLCLFPRNCITVFLMAEKFYLLLNKKVSYSGGIYPKVPTSRVGRDEPPTSVSFVSPKSAT